MNILTLSNLDIYYKKNDFIVKNFNLEIKEGEIIALVGRSGSGKTTIAKTIIGLHKKYNGKIEYGISQDDIQYIFQDPYSSLNPYATIDYIIYVCGEWIVF